MAKVEILGHTVGAVYKKEFFSECQFLKQLEKKERKTRKIKRKKIEPKLRQTKIEFTRTYILTNIYKEKDFVYKKPISKFKLNYRDIDRVEIRVVESKAHEKFYRNYKIHFYNDLNEEIFYLNFGSNNEFYDYQNSLKGFQLLVAHLNINNIEYDIFKEKPGLYEVNFFVGVTVVEKVI